MKSQMWITASLIALTTACSDGLGPNDAIDAEEAASIALDTDAITGDIIFGQMVLFGFGAELAQSAGGGEPRTFSRTRPCPAGGSIEVNGSIERTVTGERTMEFDASAEGKWNACARTRREITRTIDGEFSITSHRKIVNGQAAGPQTTTKEGHFTWSTSNDKSGECEFSVTSTRFPEEGRRTVQGSVCGREIDRTVTWSRGEG
jgi:hypothetical protein